MVISLLLLLLFLSSSIHSLSTVSISRAGNQTLVCALTQISQSNHLNCTSFPEARIQIPVNPSFASFTGVVGGDGFLCALSSSSSSSSSSVLVCWRFSTNGAGMEYRRIYRGAELQDLDSGNSHICGVTDAGRLECWQWRNRVPSGTWIASSVAVGEDFVCGVTESGRIQCLGSYGEVVGHVPKGNFSVVSAGSHHACAVSTAATLECWGSKAGEVPPSGEFTSVASGDGNSCALRRNGTMACWGDENSFRNLPEYLQTTSFISIQGNGNVFCGVTMANYSLYCWGKDGSLISSSNDSVFQNVVPGPCRKRCPCSSLPDYGSYCGQGLTICDICRSCEGEGAVTAPSLPPSKTNTEDDSKWIKNAALVAFLVVGCIGSLSLIILASFLFFKRCKCMRSVSRVHDSGPMDAPTPPALEKKLSQIISMGSSLEEYSLQTLLLATDDFSEEHKIGNGSFGSVYMGTLPGGSEIAIKRAETSASASQNCAAAATKHHQQQQDDQDSAFVNELEFMSRLNHKNLVRLLGFCEDSAERILVYEYMRNGSLSDHLYKLEMESSPILSSWPARIKVALDAARGIQYLHQFAVPPIIHRDIKPSNILLDETWTAKISDFGLSLTGPPEDESHLSLKVAGTVGYVDPEYYRLQRLTTKSDVYSFGIVLLELLSGYKAIHNNENGDPRNVVDIVVPYIVKDEIHRVLEPRVHPPTPVEIEAVAYVGYLAADCVKLEGANRPTMTEIVNSLERALAACLAPPTLPSSASISSDDQQY